MAEEQEEKISKKPARREEMSLEESRAFRASLARPAERKLSDGEKREAFRVYWAQAKANFGQTKALEEIIWSHLKAIKKDEPNKFEEGIAHFGLKKVK